MTRLIRAALAIVAAAPLAATLAAQDQEDTRPVPATSTVFARYSDRILKVQLMETSSNAKSTIGTGFFVSADGLMMTNYHVIADWIHEPEDYRVEIVDEDGSAHVVQVIAVDVVHDLAVLRTGRATPRHFSLGPVPLRQGARLYSLGHPSDLGLSIVEGTYNGNLKHTLYPKIHFTGSINRGMSGGPTITADGKVVGVNVSSMGEQRSFLVPESEATALLARVQAPGFTPSEDPIAEIAGQLRAYQEAYLKDLLTGETKTVDFGAFRVITEPAPIFRCWGGAERSDDRDEEPMYEEFWHRCATDDDVFIAEDQSSGVIEVSHIALTTTRLNRLRFASLYGQYFSRDNTPGGNEKHVTVWKCSTRNVETSKVPVRAVLCLRGLKKMTGLYDAVLKVAVLGRDDAGLISTLTLSGASFENIQRLSTQFMERISWR
jgi:S1-C subfamily serine protease